MSCKTAAFKSRSDGHLHCSYCGSINLETATRLLGTPGVRYSGSDWKYGFPHKFYLTDTGGAHLKFYIKHAVGATDDQLRSWNEATAGTVGITLTQDERGLLWEAPPAGGGHGFQAAGVVGGERSTY